MRLLLILGLSSLLFALVLTPICRNLLRRLGMVDHPDQNRKLHRQPVATMGGVPIVIAYLASFLYESKFLRSFGLFKACECVQLTI